MLALKNFFHEKGRWAEDRVIQHFRQHRLLHQRYQTPFAEIDLIFSKNAHTLLMVEVKSLSNFDFLPHRITNKQKQRLFRASEFLHSKSKRHIEINWAFVTDSGEVLVIEDVCG